MRRRTTGRDERDETQRARLEQPRVPPHNHEAEQAVLGAILLDPPSLSRAVERLTGDDFYRLAHRKIYAGMQRVMDRGEALDQLTLTAALKESGELDSVGGAAYLGELTMTVASAANLSHHASLVRDARLLRELGHVGMELLTRTAEGAEPVAGLVAWAEQTLFGLAHGRGLSTFEPVARVLADGVGYIDRMMKRASSLTGMPTGFTALDRLTAGWQSGDLVIIGGRPSMGKTSFALNTAVAAARAGHGVAIFSVEMSKSQLGLRLLAAESRLDGHALRTGRIPSSQMWELAAAASGLECLPIWIDDAGDLTLTTLRAKARRFKAQHPMGLLVVDYLQLLQGPPGLESRQQEISEISRGLKLLAKELDVTVLALSQLSRAIENREEKRPQLSDLRESGAIEQDADVVGLLYRDEAYHKESADKGIAELLIRKQRNGPIGDVRLSWLEHCASFENLGDVA